MILTGNEIARQVELGAITIDPFSRDQVKIDSYNYRLGPTLKLYRGMDAAMRPEFEEVTIPEEGLVLPPRQMTLGHTFEVIGSSGFAMNLIGRSSVGRLGLFLQVSADLGHTTSCHQWTLELVAARPIRVYPRMIIGQVTFWVNDGSVKPYEGLHGRYDAPTESRLAPPLGAAVPRCGPLQPFDIPEHSLPDACDRL